MRQQLETLDGAVSALPDAVTQAFRNVDEYRGELSMLAIHLAKSNLETIYQHSESPIERLCWASLVYGFVAVNPFGAMFMAPTADATARIADERAKAAFVAARAKEYELVSPSLKADEWLRTVTSDEEVIEWLSPALLAHSVGMDDGWRLSLQAGLPGILPNGRGIRVDLLAWRLHGRTALVVECDGFEFHTTHDRFVADRQRDRILASRGYRVLRYSGSEIHKDHVEAAMNLYGFLKAIEKEEATGT